MNIKKILTKATQKLQQNKIPTPHLDAEILLSHILKKSREYILSHPEKQLTKPQITNFKFQIAKRAKGKPVAYITGHKEFYGLDFFVNKNVLIPRPETELMVEDVLKILSAKDTRCPIGHRVSWKIIDIGTGSGCIIITLAKLLNLKSKIAPSPKLWSVGDLNLKFIATDISKQALAVARKNAKLHHVHKQIKFYRGNLLQPIITKSKILNLKSEIIITANLPYLTPTQIKNSPSIKHEPKLALSAGKDGLKYYRQLFKQIKRIKNQELKITILVEINPEQATKIKQLIKKELLNSKIQIKKDLSGHNRLISTRL